MGKIKGWEKSKQEKGLWHYGATKFKYPDGYIKIIEKDNGYFVFLKKPKEPEQRINMRMLHTYEEAKQYFSPDMQKLYDKNGKIKGWSKTHISNNALGVSERWTNTAFDTEIYLYGSIGQYGSRQYTLKIYNPLWSHDKNFSSSDREELKQKAISFMKSHPRG